MHRYLRACGFPDNITERSVLEFLDRDVVRPENLYTELKIDAESTAREYRLMVNGRVGIAAVVLFVQGRPPVLSHYFPFYEPFDEPVNEECSIDRHADREVYAGITDIPESGITLIFFINNSTDYRRKILQGADPYKTYRGAYISAFSNEGKVLLPIAKQPSDVEQDEQQRFRLNELRNAALDGDDDAGYAYESQEMYMYDQIRERAQNEDLYTLVDQTFIPDGVECDQYSVVGEILDVAEDVNDVTGEPLLFINIQCNGVKFRVCMRKKDLRGEPEPGRRLKCGIWLQAHVNLETGA
ncbi:MAG: DUF3881 family protein [Lachnospiraceae bacterium]|nr:DUF3881 family protein [Lachnospiraceae bacterium]